jgi:two-component system CheB/CheR fusion protein
MNKAAILASAGGARLEAQPVPIEPLPAEIPDGVDEAPPRPSAALLMTGLRPPPVETAPPAPSARPAFPVVVGIGASAGGLAALRAFFSHVPDDSGLAYVVVVHLSPEHESHLADLLQPHLPMPVLQVGEDVPLEANRVYVIPPNANLNSVDTHLRLSALEKERGARAPIDHFFRTLAATHDGHTVGVILTGTGSDGALGIREIKEQNGLTVAQDPGEAEYDGMPRSAISTGAVDLVLPLAAIPAAVLRFAHTEPRFHVPADGEEIEREEQRLLQKVFAQIRSRTGRDFTGYKRSTLLRRIQRRMQLAQIEELGGYLDLLRDEEGEVEALADDLLINVTNFFRDGPTWEFLAREVVPTLFEGRSANDDVRVWSVGCATGEEAYSLAILLMEEAARRETPPRIQVFASDLHESSLRRARDGFFPGDIEADVSPERLARFFGKEDGGYRIRKEVREQVVFAPHNLLGDPPFSRLDLISCRNVLIYLQREVQDEVVGLFHYALLPTGYLVVGTSETIGDSELFGVVDETHHVHRRRNVRAREPRLPVVPPPRPPTLARMPARTTDAPAAYGALHQKLVERFAPPSMLLGPDERVVHLSENAGRYLVHPGGEPTTSAAKLVREELRIELRSALHAVQETGGPFRSKPIPVAVNGDRRFVVLRVSPAGEPEQKGFTLVTFDEQPAADPLPGPADGATDAARRGSGAPPDARVRELEEKLELAEHRLQRLIEESNAAQEEMRAGHEELQSSNEELRSTMEELETSKEELQSTNEELQALNQENRHKVEELLQLSGDLQNLLTATEIATLFLDRHSRILRFTPKVGELFNVRPVDRGRPLSDLTRRLGYDALDRDVEEVLRTLVPVEREVQDEGGRWYLTRVLPYRSTDDRIEGVVITFFEITERKRAEEALREAKIYAESIVETLHEPLLILTPDLRVQSANPAFYEHFSVARGETEDRRIYDLGNGQWDIPALRTLLEEVLPESRAFKDYEVAHDFEGIGPRVMRMNGRRLDHVQLIMLGIRDVTESRRAEDDLREAQREAEQAS